MPQSHVEDDGTPRIGAKVPVEPRVLLALVAVDEGHAVREASMRQGQCGRCGRAERSGDARNDGARDIVPGERLELLASAPEHERVAALEPCNPLARERVAQQQLVDLLLAA